MLRDNQQFNESIKSNSAFFDELRQKMPEFFTATKYDEQGNLVESSTFDNEKFQQALKEHNIDELSSGYRLDFIGKNYAKKQAGERPTTVIVPDSDHNQKEENKNSKNLFFTGDNLEVLRHLQQNYANSVDFIYIDPPYNTGSDGFVYPDNFEYSDNQLKDMFALNDDDLKRLKSIQGKATHSAWLTFMYPRLYLAKKVLKDTGVIFVSIDDNEQANLKLLMDEVFGEVSNLANLIWDRNHSAQSGIFKVYHEYICVYSKNAGRITTPKSSNNDLFEAGAVKKIDGRHPLTEFTFPRGTRFDAPNETELSGEWGDAEKVRIISGRLISENGKLKENVTLAAGFTQKNQMQAYFYENREILDSRGQKIHEFYLNRQGKVRVIKERGVETPPTIHRWGTQSVASTHLARLFNSEVPYFDSPKPVGLVKNIIKWFTESDSIILDFFAGSSTTAHAVMQLNSEDGGNRQYIMCTLPEPTFTVNSDGKEVPTKGGEAAYKAGYRSIDEISRERIIRAANKIKEENPLLTESQDFGFKHYRVVTPTQETLDKIDYDDQLQLDLFDDMIDAFSSEKLGVAGNADGFDTILHTYLAKDNYQFDVPLQMKDFAGIQLPYVNNQRIYLIANNWRAENTRALVNAIGKNELVVQTIVVYGYTLEMESLRELEIAFNQLENKVNLQVRY